MAWKIETGAVKASLWPDAGNGSCWCPVDDEINEIFYLPGVEEVSSECAQPYKVIVEADSLEELPAVIESVKAELFKIIRKYARQRAHESAINHRVLTRGHA